MIPKIIHLCWLSGDPYPRKIQDCLIAGKNTFLATRSFYGTRNVLTSTKSHG